MARGSPLHDAQNCIQSRTPDERVRRFVGVLQGDECQIARSARGRRSVPPVQATILVDDMASHPLVRRWRGFVVARLDRKGYLGLHVTVGLLVTVAGVALFSTILEELLESAPLVRWDAAQSVAMHARVTPPGLALFGAITHLGSPTVVSVLGVLAVLMLWRRRRVLALACVAAWVGEALLNQSIKHLVHRTRPLYGAEYLHGQSFSFPSGHAMGPRSPTACSATCWFGTANHGEHGSGRPSLARRP